VNLNGLRYPENLFALLDDPYVFNQVYNAGTQQNDHIDTLEAARDWWFQFVAARDGRDPQTGLILPGAPASRPFRGRAYAEGGSSALDRTMLRRLPLDNEDVNDSGALDPGEDANNNTLLDANANGARRLFEARTAADLPISPAANSVDHHTRHRLLSKISGNTTQRGNVFAVWVTVGFFQGYQPDPVNNPDVIQIGAEMTDQPRRRGFFVIDRSLLEDAYDQATGTFDWRKFVQYRKTVQ
jgi:hypothetical protein